MKVEPRGVFMVRDVVRWVIVTLPVFVGMVSSAIGNDAEFDAIQQATQRTAPSVVQIETIGASSSDGELALGAPISGTVIDDQGHVLTSSWGLEETPASILIVLPDGSRQPAQLIARDSSRELALLKTSANEKLTPISLTRSTGLRVGQWAIAIGRGITPDVPAVAVGIVSATERVYGRAVQIDARISPSFYGGPVVDIHGEVIGISVPMKPDASSAGEKSDWYDSGIAFVVPIDAISKRIEQLKSGKDVKPGKLGIVPKSKMPFSDDRTLSAVLALSPAKRAGVQSDDELIAIDGQPVRWNADIKQLLGPRDAGEVVNIKVLRDSQELEFDVELAAEIPAFRPRVLGVLTKLEEDSVLITHVFPDSAAEKAELAVGDQIQAVDGVEVSDTERLRIAVMMHTPGESLPLTIIRNGKTMQFNCDLQWTPETVVESLPELEPTIDEGDYEIVERSLPDVANKSFLLKPKKQDVTSFGLLVLLTRPGSEKLDDLVEGWRELATAQHLAVLAIAPAEKDRWKPTESDLIVRMIQQVQKIVNLKDQQIVLGGFGAGAEMGLMVALRNREFVRGAVVPSGSRPGGIALSENDPSSPVQFLVVGGKEMPIWGRVIANVGFPVVQEPSPAKDPLSDDPGVRDAVGRWIRSLDRI